MKNMKLAVLVALLAAVATACGGDKDTTGGTSPTATVGGATYTVDVVDNEFKPSEVSGAVGDTVTWTWVDTAQSHNVVADIREGETTGAFSSGSVTAEAGTTFSHTFTAAGTFTYTCQVHGTAGMAGTITIA